MKWRTHTQQELVDAFFTNPQLKTHLSLIADYMGLPPSRASGLMMCLVLLSFWRNGGPVVPARESYQILHNELARALVERNGGVLRMQTRVTGIAVKQNQVAGVEFREKRGAVNCNH